MITHVGLVWFVIFMEIVAPPVPGPKARKTPIAQFDNNQLSDSLSDY
jgi:hypothetical protein